MVVTQDLTQPGRHTKAYEGVATFGGVALLE